MIFAITFLLAVVSCEHAAISAHLIGHDPSKICAGEVIEGVEGRAYCSGTSAGSSLSLENSLYVLSTRNDIDTIGDWSSAPFLANLVSEAIDRSEGITTFGTISRDSDFLNFFKVRYQAIPNPVSDSDGRGTANGAIAKKHFLDRIVGRPDQACGSTGTITQRIDHCDTINGVKAFYHGKQYGQEGEGDWRLVTRLASGQEVWRDERTKLLWSDKSAVPYNWYRAAGYAKPTATSQAETGYDSQPGSGTQCEDFSGSPESCQPSNPISVCAEVNDSGVVIAGGAHPSYDGTYVPTSDPSIEKAFKGDLGIADNVIWKLPSIDDFKLADVNGLRKVLPNIDFVFLSATSYSLNRFSAWGYDNRNGYIYDDNRSYVANGLEPAGRFVRCIGFSRN